MLTDLDPIDPATTRRAQGFDVFDADVRPPERFCLECGVERTWTWLDWLPIRPRWTTDACQACQKRANAPGFLAKLELAGRQKRAGIPRRYRGFRLDRAVVPAKGETVEAFQSRLNRTNGASGKPWRIGCPTEDSQRLLAMLRDWTPDGLRSSLLLHGPVGTGKTLLLSAMATRLLDVKERRVVDLWDAGRAEPPPTEEATEYALARGLNRATTGAPSFTVVYCTAEEIAQREVLSWKKDPAPLAAAVEADVLILDELATSDEPGKPELQAIQRAVRFRYDAGLPLVMATNRDPAQLLGGTCPYGRRVADRLAEAVQVPIGKDVGGNVHRLGGVSWRGK